MLNHSIYTKILLFLSIITFLSCLPFEAICIEGDCAAWPSWSILLFGWLNITSSFSNIIWIANPLVICSWIAIIKLRKNISIALSLSAILIALSFLFFEQVSTNEGGVSSEITGIKIGYLLWLLSLFFSLLTSLTIKMAVDKEREEPIS